MDGSEDGPSRTSEAHFLAHRASRGLRARAGGICLVEKRRGPHLRRRVGTLDAEPEGVGGGVAGVRTPVCYQRPGCLDSMRVEAVLRLAATR
jgi:hypothetical protein